MARCRARGNFVLNLSLDWQFATLLDLMIEASSSPRVWLLELNSFPAAAPFAQEHGKSAAFHHEQVGFCAALLSLVLADRAQLLGGVSRLDEMAKWRVVAEEKHTQF